jgi:UDP-N-acetylglucosamine 1-carboxyvinyltransferase
LRERYPIPPLSTSILTLPNPKVIMPTMRLVIQGRAPLRGTYYPSGNSNEAIALIAASLLSSQPSVLNGVPQTDAVRWMLAMAEDLGASCTWTDNSLQLETPRLAARHIHPEDFHGLLASILLVAPVLAAREHATLQWHESLGRLHTHLTALRDLGIRVDIEGNTIHMTAQRWDSQKIVLPETSVTATALICMLAAVMGKETVIYNAASEPHLRSLQQFLVKMGVGIDGIGSNLLHIRSVEGELAGASHDILPNHIEIASLAAIAAITPGHVTVNGVIPDDLIIINKVFERLGATVFLQDNTLHLPDNKHLMISNRQEDVDVEIDTAPWPGFPSDLVAIATVMATQANGTTLIHEKLFDNRLLFVDKLKAMGAQIVLADPHRAIVIGATPLRAEYMDTPDVRIGLALLAAALCAEGETVIDRAEVIDRNFAGVIQKLIDLGAAITIENAHAAH